MPQVCKLRLTCSMTVYKVCWGIKVWFWNNFKMKMLIGILWWYSNHVNSISWISSVLQTSINSFLKLHNGIKMHSKLSLQHFLAFTSNRFQLCTIFFLYTIQVLSFQQLHGKTTHHIGLKTPSLQTYRQLPKAVH